MSLIDYTKWHAVWDGCFNYTLSERDEKWTYDDDVDFILACRIKRLIGA